MLFYRCLRNHLDWFQLVTHKVTPAPVANAYLFPTFVMVLKTVKIILTKAVDVVIICRLRLLCVLLWYSEKEIRENQISLSLAWLAHTVCRITNNRREWKWIPRGHYLISLIFLYGNVQSDRGKDSSDQRPLLGACLELVLNSNRLCFPFLS